MMDVTCTVLCILDALRDGADGGWALEHHGGAEDVSAVVFAKRCCCINPPLHSVS